MDVIQERLKSSICKIKHHNRENGVETMWSSLSMASVPVMFSTELL